VVARGGMPGDPVLALMAYVDSPRNPVRERDRAVWALGQLGDPRALSVLEKHRSGEPCEHGKKLCQHELEKAVKLCRGAPNVAAWVWRRAGRESRL